MDVPVQRILDHYGQRVAQLTQENVVLTATNEALRDRVTALEEMVASDTQDEKGPPEKEMFDEEQ